VFSDGISYIDIAQAYARGDWAAALNAYWSPLYSWVMAVCIRVLHLDPAACVPLFHVLNASSFVASAFAFEFFLRNLATYCGMRRVPASWLVFGYCCVVWSGVTRITTCFLSPDILVTSIVFVASGLLLRMRFRPGGPTLFAFFGALLGIGYLTKGVFFVLALAFYLPAAIVAFRREAFQRVAVAALVFLVVCSPLIAALSFHKGRLTFGDTGKLNYGWEVLGIPRYFHWQGDTGDHGTPEHPTNRVLGLPETYTFASPVPGTYPPWYDPSYWHEGLKAQLDVAKQLVALRRGLLYEGMQVLLAPGAVLLLLIVAGKTYPRWLAGHLVRRYWFLLLPSVGALLTYALVFVDRRYISGFIVVIMAALWATLAANVSRARLLVHGTVALGVLTTVGLVLMPGTIDKDKLLNDYPFKPLARNMHADFANAARRAGMLPRDPVAFVGLGDAADWLRINESRIVAEVPVIAERRETLARVEVLNLRNLIQFWTANPQSKAMVFEECRKAGARWIAADHLPAGADTTGWVLLGGVGETATYIRKL